MKVGLVCPYNMYKGGGVQECVLAIRAELERRGHTAKVISPLPMNTDTKPMNGVIFIGTAAQVRSPFHTTAQVSVSVRADLLDSVLEKEKFDVLHFHEPWVPILSRQILSRSNATNIATFHAKLPDTIMSKTIEKVITPYTKSILKYLDHLCAVSEAASEYVTSLTDAPVTVIPNGINIAEYSKRKTVKKQTILYIGRLERRKGVKYLLKAFSRIATPDVELIIAGDGSDRSKLEAYVKQNKIANVTFRGYISDKVKKDLLSKATVFCSPALYGESFGIVLLEAIAMGVPVVAGDNPGYEAVLKDAGKHGLINPKDIKAFTRKLDLMLTDVEFRNLWQQWAKSYITQFDYTKIVDKYEELYKKALKERS